MRLYPWQRAVTDVICNQAGTGRVCVVCAPRQRGKSYMCEGVLLHYAINQQGSINALISPTMAQARKIYKEIVNAIIGSGIIAKKNETLLEIELINGSTIFFKSAEIRDGLRGYKVTGVVILDEAAFLSPEVLELVLPWRQVSNAPMLLVSTPKIRDGVFYNYYKEGLDGNGKVVTIDWKNWDTSIMMPPEMLQQYKKILTANQFKSEILGEFLDDDGLVFSYIKENLEEEPVTTYHNIYIGIDFGAGNSGDYTAFAAFNENGEMVFLDYFNDLTTLKQIDRLVADLTQCGNSVIAVNAENNSIGKPLIDLIVEELNKRGQKMLVSRINRWTTTNKTKGELVNQMQVALEQGQSKLIDDRMLVNQFGAYEAEYNAKTQTVTYNGAVGTNDDIVMATMLAWDAYIKAGRRGHYSISVV